MQNLSFLVHNLSFLIQNSSFLLTEHPVFAVLLRVEQTNLLVEHQPALLPHLLRIPHLCVELGLLEHEAVHQHLAVIHAKRSAV